MTRQCRLREPDAASRPTICIITALLVTLLAASCGGNSTALTATQKAASSSPVALAPAQAHYKNRQYRFSVTYPSGLAELPPSQLGQLQKGLTVVCYLGMPGARPAR